MKDGWSPDAQDQFVPGYHDHSFYVTEVDDGEGERQVTDSRSRRFRACAAGVSTSTTRPMMTARSVRPAPISKAQRNPDGVTVKLTGEPAPKALSWAATCCFGKSNSMRIIEIAGAENDSKSFSTPTTGSPAARRLNDDHRYRRPGRGVSTTSARSRRSRQGGVCRRSPLACHHQLLRRRQGCGSGADVRHVDRSIRGGSIAGRSAQLWAVPPSLIDGPTRPPAGGRVAPSASVLARSPEAQEIEAQLDR